MDERSRTNAERLGTQDQSFCSPAGESSGQGDEHPTSSPGTFDTLPSPERVSVGTVIGQSEVLGFLAEGGMGEVYLARQPKLDRQVVLKLLRKDSGAELRKRFDLEGRAYAQLSHAHIVKVFEVGEWNHRPYLCMEFLCGGTLRERIRRERLPVAKAVRYLQAIAEAVHHAHESNLLHRDLKPENILFDARDTPAVADFGLARPIEKLDHDSAWRTEAGAVLGTLPYMAPEQISGRVNELGRGTDIFALGVILYELLTGKLPFAGSSYFELMSKITGESPPRPKKVNSEIDGDLEDICLRCLAKDPAHRFATALDLAQELELWQGHQSVTFKPQTFPGVARKWFRRHWAAAFSLLVGITALFAATALLAVHAISTKHELENAKGLLEKNSDRLQTANDELEQKSENLRQLGKAQKAALVEKTTALLDLHRSRGWQLARERDEAAAMLWYAEAIEVASEPEQRNTAWEQFRFWEGRSWEPIAAIRHSGASKIGFLDVTDSGASLISGGNGVVEARLVANEGDRFWDELVPEGHQIFSADYDDESNLLAIGTNKGQVVVHYVSATRKTPASVEGHRDLIRSVRFGPARDGVPRTLVTASTDGTAILWDLTLNGDEISLSRKHVFEHRDGSAQTSEPARESQRQIRYAEISPDGRIVATAGQDMSVRLWSTESGRMIGQPLQHKGMVQHLRFHFGPEVQQLVSTSYDGTAIVWRAASRSDNGARDQASAGSAPHVDAELAGWLAPFPRVLNHGSAVLWAEFAPDGGYVVTAGTDGMARVWQASDGAPVGQPARHSDRVLMARFSPDREGRFFVTACQDGIARVWETRSGLSASQPFSHRRPIHTAAFSHDGSQVLTASDDGIAVIWQQPDRQRYFSHNQRVTSLQFSPDSTRLVSTSFDGTAMLFDLATGQPTRPLLHESRVHSASFSADGKWLVTASDKGASVWDLESDRVPEQIESGTNIWQACFSASADELYLNAGVLGKRFAARYSRQNGGRFEPNTTPIRGLGTTLDEPIRTCQGTTSVKIVTLSSDLHTAYVWDIATAKRMGDRVETSGEIKAASLSPDGRMLALAVAPAGDRRSSNAATVEDSFQIWNVESGERLALPSERHEDAVLYVAWRPDGRQLVSCSADHTARLWNLTEAQALAAAPKLDHRGPVTYAAFSADCQYLATGSADQSARIWDTAGHRVGPALSQDATITYLTFSPDGKWLAIGTQNGKGQWWQMARPLDRPPIAIQEFREHAQLMSFRKIDTSQILRVLDLDEWSELRKKVPPRRIER